MSAANASATRVAAGKDVSSRQRVHRLSAAVPTFGGELSASIETVQQAVGNRAFDALVRRHGGRALQRKCACESTGQPCATCARERLQRKGRTDAPLHDVPSIVDEALSEPGRALDSGTRGLMESRFNADFSSVRVHTSARAAASAEAVDALAYTVGSHIVFGSGRFATSSTSARELIAHELAHVVQQSDRRVVAGAGGGDLEQEADTAARLVTRGGVAPALSRSGRGVARKPKDKPTPARLGVSKGSGVVSITLDGALIATVTYDAAAGEPTVQQMQGPESLEGVSVVTPKGSNSYGHAEGAYNELHANGVVSLSAAEDDPDTEGDYFVTLHAKQTPLPRPKTLPKTPVVQTPPAPIEKQEEPKEEKEKEKREDPNRKRFNLPKKSADELIDDDTTFGDLDEETLGARLFMYAADGDLSIVTETLDKLGSTDRDDVATAFVSHATEEELAKLAQTEEGRKLLLRLYHEMTSGYLSADEKEQADRLMKARAQAQIDPQRFLDAPEKAKVIPFSGIGFTKFSSASLDVKPLDNGKIWVKSHMKQEHWKDARGLPKDFILGLDGMELDPDEVVGVKLYDEGGKIVYIPAIYLLQLGNQEDAKVLSMSGEAIFTGLTLGVGGGATAGGEVITEEGTKLTGRALWAARAAKTAKVLDTTAAAFGAASVLINDHRGWILEKFGKDGEAFLNAWSAVETVVAIYSVGRLGFGLAQKAASLRGTLAKLRERRAGMQLSAEEDVAFNRMTSQSENTLDELEQGKRSSGGKGTTSAADEPPVTGAGDDPAAAGEKKGGRTGAPAPEGGVTREDEVLAKRPTSGGHDIEVTARGVQLCSPPPCAVLRTRYARELKNDAALMKELDEIDAMRLGNPEEAARRGVDLQKKLEARRLAAGGGHQIPDDVLDDIIGTIDELETRAKLDVSQKRAAAIQSGDKNLPDVPAAFDIDEPLAVGAPGVKPQRQVTRALDPHNRQLLDPATNRATKGVRTSPADIARGRHKLPPTSVSKDPGAIFTRRFDEVVELQQVFDEALAKIGNRGALKPTALKNQINQNIRDIIQNGRSPAGVAVRDALKAQGFEFEAGRGIVQLRQP